MPSTGMLIGNGDQVGILSAFQVTIASRYRALLIISMCSYTLCFNCSLAVDLLMWSAEAVQTMRQKLKVVVMATPEF